MSISFSCSSCQTKLRTTKPENAGKLFKCPKCGQTLTVPSAQGAIVSEAPKIAASPPLLTIKEIAKASYNGGLGDDVFVESEKVDASFQGKTVRWKGKVDRIIRDGFAADVLLLMEGDQKTLEYRYLAQIALVKGHPKIEVALGETIEFEGTVGALMQTGNIYNSIIGRTVQLMHKLVVDNVRLLSNSTPVPQPAQPAKADAAKGSEHYHQTTPASAAEKTAAMQLLIEELTGFKFKRPGGKETMQSALQIMLTSREDTLDRIAYYRGWMSEGTFPYLKLFVLDRVSDEMRFPHMMFLTGPLSANIAFLSDKGYEARVKKYVAKGRLEMADTYQDFDVPGFSTTKRIGWDFADKILKPGMFAVSLVIEPKERAVEGAPAQADTSRPTPESITRAIESAGGTVKPRTDGRGGLAVTVRDTAVLPHLAVLSDIQVLDLSGSVSDSGLAHLASLKSLDNLSLDRTGITDAGLKHLAQLTSLSQIRLSGTLVSDAGLQHLVPLKNLGALWVRDTRITKGGLDALARAACIMVISDMYGMHSG